MALSGSKCHALLGNINLIFRSSTLSNSAIPSIRSLDSQNNHSPICQRRRRKEFLQFASSGRALHSDTNLIDDNLFKIRVIEIDNKGNSEVKNMRLETLVNELRATEKLKLDKILNERTDKDLYNWSRTGIMERRSILSKEYQKQKRSQIPLRDLRMFFRHINLGM